MRSTLHAKLHPTYSQEYKIDDQLRRYAVDDNNVLRISYTDHDAQMNLNNEKGEIGEFRQTSLLGQMTELHVTTNKWWIYYSDVFGIAMLTIALTRMFIVKGQNSFRKRGWKLALIGIIFPLTFLFLLG